jgi:hypothetical protein
LVVAAESFSSDGVSDADSGDDVLATHDHPESELEEEVDAKEQLKDDLHDAVERTSGKQARKEEEKTVVDETSVNGDNQNGEGDDLEQPSGEAE